MRLIHHSRDGIRATALCQQLIILASMGCCARQASICAHNQSQNQFQLVISIMLSASRRIRHNFAKHTVNPFKRFISSVQTSSGIFRFFGLAQMNDPKLGTTVHTQIISHINVVRNCDQFQVKTIDVMKVLNWQEAYKEKAVIPFKPTRVLLQDFTGISVLVDLGQTEALRQMGGDPRMINPQCPVDLVIDHSIQTDVTRVKNAWAQNQRIEFQTNRQRFEFLKWASTSFSNLSVIPPEGGILHQINLEFLGKLVITNQNQIYPDTIIGADPHTSTANGMGILGWRVGGLEAEAVILGQPIPMQLPQVLGIRFLNKLREGVTATDLVLTLTNQLKKKHLSGKFVQFFGPGVATLSVPDRATVSNMAPEYGAEVAYFPPDNTTLIYLKETDRDTYELQLIEKTLKAMKLFRVDQSKQNLKFSNTMTFDLSKIEPSVSGPKRPSEWMPLYTIKENWKDFLSKEKGITQEQIPSSSPEVIHKFRHHSKEYQINHGSIIIAAITSCINTMNPRVMIGAGLLAKKAVQKGLRTKPYIKTSLSAGSVTVTQYLQRADLSSYLNILGFNNAGYGCMTSVGNSGQIDKEMSQLIKKQDLIVCSVTSGNRNYQTRLHRRVKANYLMSPALVVAFAIAGTVNINLQKQPLGTSQNGEPVFLKDIWPSDQEINLVVQASVTPQIYKRVYNTLFTGTWRWNSIIISPSLEFKWNKQSTFIQKPPYLENIDRKLREIESIKNAFVLAYLGDYITTDHISPPGRIPRDSLAGKYLASKGIQRKDFGTYGARRGNFEILLRGTFSNPYLINKLAPVIGPKTVYVPTGEVLDFMDAAVKYKELGHPTIILAGSNYGIGAPRDWAAKGPYLLGVRAVIAQSFNDSHRNNLLQMGILPLEFTNKENASTLQLTGKETFNINIPHKDLQPGQLVVVSTNVGKEFRCRARLDTELQIEQYRQGGILPYNLRKLRNKK